MKYLRISIKFTISLILLLLISLILDGCIKHKNEYVIIKIGDNKVTKPLNQEFDIRIDVKDAVNVIGLNARIAYDPLILEPIKDGANIVSSSGDFFSNPVSIVGMLKDEGGAELPGTLVIGCSGIPAVAASGDGSMITIKFKGIAAGNTDIHFVNGYVALISQDGNEVGIDQSGDMVEIVEEVINAKLTITVL